MNETISVYALVKDKKRLLIVKTHIIVKLRDKNT